MKKLVLLFAALLVAGCGEKSPNNPEIKQALKNAVWDGDLEWRDGKGLVTHEPQQMESSDGRRIYTMGYGIDRMHLRGESEPYSGWVLLINSLSKERLYETYLSILQVSCHLI